MTKFVTFIKGKEYSKFLTCVGLIDQSVVYKIYWEAGILLIGSLMPTILLIRNSILIIRSLQNTCKKKRNKTVYVLFATIAVFIVCHCFRYVTAGFIFFNPITNGQTEYCIKQGK